MRGIIEDLKHAVRVYRRTPGASVMVVLVLAIGMAFVAAFLSLYSGLILRPEPGFEPGLKIVSVGWNDGRNAGGPTYELIERMSKESTTLAHTAGSMLQQFRIGTDEQPGSGELVTKDFFPGLRPTLALGRGFTAEEHDAQGEPVVVISWRYWQQHFAGRPDVLGRTIRIQGMQPNSGPPGSAQQDDQPKDFRIVGVMGREFIGILPPQSTDKTVFWMPVERGLGVGFGVPEKYRAQTMRRLTMRGIARRARGVSNAAVIRELAGRFSDNDFMKRPGVKFEVIDRIVQNVFTQRAMQRQLWLFLSASVMLALVAAANVSLFLLARAPGRRRELGIRMAVGAPLRRLVRQLVSESALLVLAAAVLGLALSMWLAKYLRGLPFLRQAQWREVTLLDWRVLTLVGVFLLLVTLLVSLAPIAGLKRLGIAASSRQVAARATLAQRIAGTAQVAIAGVLGGAAIAFTWYLISTLLADPGYRTQGLYAAPYTIPQNRSVRLMPTKDGRFVAEGIVDAARKREVFGAIPGVTQLSLADAVPGLQLGSNSTTVPDPQNPQQTIHVNVMMVDSHYVDLLGLKLLHGRNLTDGDFNGALVNQKFAQRFFGREDVVGEPIRDLAPEGQPHIAFTPGVSRITQIVGVIKDFSFGRPLDSIDPMVFNQTGLGMSGVALLESKLPLAALQKQIQDAANALDLRVPGSVISLTRAHHDILAPDRARGFLTIATAVIVVLLAGFGFYGVQRYLVMAGRREYAIRAALGAGPRSLGRLVLRRGLLLGVPGLVLGVPLAFIAVAWLRDDYVSRDVSAAVVTLAVMLGLIGLLLAASLGPARLARRTQPAPLLRED
jgi:putative ABC transport system permease protein